MSYKRMVQHMDGHTFTVFIIHCYGPISLFSRLQFRGAFKKISWGFRCMVVKTYLLCLNYCNDLDINKKIQFIVQIADYEWLHS